MEQKKGHKQEPMSTTSPALTGTSNSYMSQKQSSGQVISSSSASLGKGKGTGTASRADQGHLPELPIPPLEQSIEKLLETAKPLLNEEKHRTLQKVARDFMGRSGDTDKSVGQRLQDGLINWKERERARLCDQVQVGELR